MSHDNPEIGELLDLLGNNTRRRILESLTNEPKYFIQLSKEKQKKLFKSGKVKFTAQMSESIKPKLSQLKEKL